MTMGLLSLVWVCALAAAPASANDAGESVRFRGRSAMRVEAVRPSGAGGVLFDTEDSDPPAAPYDTVLLHGLMPDPGVRIELAVPTLGGVWHRWAPAEVKRFPNGRFWARYKFNGVSRRTLRLRAVDAGIRTAHLLALYDAELFVAGAGPEPEPAARAGEGRAAVSAASYRLVTREDWGARPATEKYEDHLPARFTMHHTAGTKPRTYDEAVQEMRFIQDYHINGRGWIDIGYHFVISPAGHAFQGRPEGAKGAHALGHNTGNLGVSFMGNYHAPIADEPAQESLDAFVSLGRRLSSDYAIPPERLETHRDLGSTDCPGDILYAKFPELKALIAGQAPPTKAPEFGALPVLPPSGFSATYLDRLPW
ncbi:MAG: N-acetylmuramoyl-L-alanine amidase [Elusimicrobia bacterium]|nr:N-acetylmuramoyl-L-alanine amidase [Elusimicrobiota bacterium]